MARYRLLQEVDGLPAGTKITDSPHSPVEGDLVRPDLCRAPRIEVMVPLDANAVTCFAAVGVIVHEGWEPPSKQPEKGN